MQSKWPNLIEQLESLIDSNSAKSVLEAFVEVCHEKAEHLCANWQDSASAKVWETLAAKLDKVTQYAPN